MKKLIAVIFISLSIPFHVWGQKPFIKGKIVDDSTGRGIAGVHIYSSSNQRTGTVSNSDGNFSLPINSRSVVFSHVGYTNVLIDMRNQTSEILLVRMIQKPEKLNEVVVTEKRLTGELVMNEVTARLKQNHKVEPVYYNFYNRLVNFEDDSTLHTLEEYTGMIFQNWSSETKYNFEKVRYGAFSKKGKEGRGNRVIAADKMKIDNIFKYKEDYLSERKRKNYSYKIIDRVEILDRSCFVIRFYTDRKTYYKQGMLYVDMEDYAIVRKTLEDKSGQIVNDITFIKINDKWYIRKALDYHPSFRETTVNLRVTLYNVTFDTKNIQKSDFVILSSRDFVRGFSGKYNDDYWEDINYIPLPDWIKTQVESN